MKVLGSFLAVVVLALGLTCCGGGGGGDSTSFDPTGTEWQFLVGAADAGGTMYTLTFFDAQGPRAASGVFTAVNDRGDSYSGPWTSSGNVVTGASSAAFVFTLTVSADAATGTVDYVAPEGSGSAPATRTDSPAAGCSLYAGSWAVTADEIYCDGQRSSGAVVMTVGSDCSATMCFTDTCADMVVAGNRISASGRSDECGAVTLEGTFASATSLSGSWSYSSSGGGTFSLTKR
jgi:hypothetical protein